MIPALAIAGVVASLASTAYSAYKSKKQADDARAEQSKQTQELKADNDRWYNVRMNEDFTQRTDAQAALNKQREMYNDALKRARATNTVSGGTAASLALQQQAAANGVADTASDIAAKAASEKSNIERQYRSADKQIRTNQINNDYNDKMSQAQMTAAAGAQAAQAFGNLASLPMKIKS